MTHPARATLLAALLLAAGCAAPPSPSGPGPQIAAATAPPRWASVDVGDGHACALDTEGRAFCWGSNHDGQLGARTPKECAPDHHGGDHLRCWPSGSDVPVAAARGMRFAALSAGGTRSCGLDHDGRAWCWGESLGSSAEGCAGGAVCSFDPVPIAPEVAFRWLSAEDDAVCGITRAGEGHCFRPRHGDRRPWSMVRVAPGHRLSTIEHYGHWMARDRHVICAVDEAGSVLCQGDNRFAQLGTGDTLPREGAVRVRADAPFTEVRMRNDQACGLTTEGAVLCWGWAARRPSWPGGSPPEPELFACTMSAWCGGPRPAAPGMRFTALTLGYQSFCGLAASGELHCWGMDGVPARAAEGVRFAAVDGGRRRSCGITAEGAAWCWGGDTAEDRMRLVRVPEPPGEPPYPAPPVRRP